ncbi:Patellin-5 [Dionaea muscipula]
MAGESEKTSLSFQQMLVLTDVSESEKSKPAAESPVSAGSGNLPGEEVSDTATGDAEALKTTAVESATAGALPEHERKALDEFKKLIREALDNYTLLTTPPLPPPPQEEATVDKEVAAGTESVKDVEDKEAISETVTTTTKVISVDEDGAKTVEAIEETVVSIAPPQDPSQAVPPPPLATEARDAAAASQSVWIWGIPLLKDERSDVVLWKFLRARDFKVNDAFTMLKNTIRWRMEFKIEELVDEDLEDEDLKKAVFMQGTSRDGNPVCYNVYGVFQSKELYQKVFADEEKRQRFLRWRIQLLEKSIRRLDFRPGGVSTIVQVNDLRNSPGLGKWELRLSTKQALQLLQDNYPEFVAKQVFINVPWWYMTVNKMISPFLTQRTKSKFVFAGPSRSAETLLNYIALEQVPIHYGGLSCDDGEFGPGDAIYQMTIKPGSKETLEFSVSEPCHLTWEVRVVGWEVSYGAEFVPNAEDGYTVIIQKIRKVTAEESIVRSSFKVGEPGKVVLSFDNAASRRKQLLYRLKAKPPSSSSSSN